MRCNLCVLSDTEQNYVRSPNKKILTRPRQMAKFLSALIWVCLCVAVVQSGNCPHEDASLKKWSDDSTWEGNDQNPSKSNSTVLVNKRILMDVQPKYDIGRLHIAAGAELVFSPDVDIDLSVRSILVEGKLTIGSEDCLYTGKLTTTIKGLITDADDHAAFGKKYIGVESGGSLDIHGQYKKSWTKLSETLPALPQSAVIFHKKVTQEDKVQGLMVQAFYSDTGKPDGEMKIFNIRQKTQEKTEYQIQNLNNTLSGFAEGRTVAIAIRKSILNKDSPMDLSNLHAVIETFAFGSVNFQSLMRKLTFYDGFSIIFVKGDSSFTVQKFDAYKAGGVGQTSTAKLLRRDHNIKIEVTSFTSSRGHGRSFVEFLVTDATYSLPVLTLVDDVSTWEIGDTIVISSTDYDWRQFEYATLIDCKGKCKNNQVQTDLSAKFLHYGKVTKNVDMRAAVAVMTRNVLFQGDMANGDDTYGAHLRCVRGVKRCNIENAELAHMGQNDALGKYPVHLHKLGATTPANTYFKNLCVHHTYSRCFTIHATDNVEVIDNSCIESHGHGYFLEDGSELNTLFDGNLGFGQRRGNLLDSDSSASTFYLSSPVTRVRNNYAAGAHGNGFWWLFPQGPAVQPEARNGSFFNTEAPILEYSNNVACGNVKNGHMINGKILANGDAKDTSNYEPNEEVLIERNTGFKNSVANFNFRGDNLNIGRLSGADAPCNIMLEGVKVPTPPYLYESVFIGDSENTGIGVFDDEGEKIWNRSLPIIKKGRPNLPRIGLSLPGTTVSIDGVWFSGFRTTQYYNAGAIGFKSSMTKSASLQTEVMDAKFDYADPTKGNRAYIDTNSTISSGKEYSILQDVDGTLTSIAGSHVVRPTDFHMSDNCVKRNNWNMAICDEAFVQVLPTFKTAKTNNMVMYRLDNTATATGPSKHVFNAMVGYLYGINWNEGIPSSITLQGRNIDMNNNVVIGVCVRKGTTPGLSIKNAEKKDSVDEITAPNHYFFDEDVGIIFVNLMRDTERDADDRRQCMDGKCVKITISTSGENKVNNDCIENYLDKYPESRKKRAAIAKSPRMRRAVNVPEVLEAGDANPPQEWGAGPQI